MRRLHRVEVASEVQINLVRRLDRRHASAGAAAFVTEYGTQGRLSDRECHVLTDLRQPLSQPNRGCRFAFTRRRRSDRRNHDELAGGSTGRERLKRDLCFVVSVGFDICRGEAEVLSDVGYRAQWHIAQVLSY